MIERTYRITVTKEITLNVAEEHIDDEAVKCFNSSIFPVNDKEEILEHAASIIAEYGSVFVEGVGSADDMAYTNPVILYHENNGMYDIEVERLS